MANSLRILFLTLIMSLVCRFAAAQQMMSGPTAPDFPPGSFSDHGQYNLDDFKGKLLVLFFYEKECPRCRGEIPQRNAVVDQFKDKPVKFIAVGPNDSMNDVIAYERETKLKMTTFADTLGVMEARYGFHISLQNIYQFRYIGPDGNVVSSGDFTPENVEAALKSVKWKYKDGGYDQHLSGAIELLEWNQYPAGVQTLRPWLKNKTVGDSARKLYAAVKDEGKQWLDQANQAKSSDPVQAFDLYAKVSATFPGEDLAKTADEALKTLRTSSAVKDELTARRMYGVLFDVMTRARTKDRSQVADYCQELSDKYPETPTGKKAALLVHDLQNAEKWSK